MSGSQKSLFDRGGQPILLLLTTEELLESLSKGVVFPPGWGKKSTPIPESLIEGGRKIFSTVEGDFAVSGLSSRSQPCLVEFSEGCEKAGVLNPESGFNLFLPASLIQRVYFSEESHLKKFRRSLAIFKDIPGDHFEALVEKSLSFVINLEAVAEAPAEEAPAEEAQAEEAQAEESEDEAEESVSDEFRLTTSERVAGALSALLVHDDLPVSILNLIRENHSSEKEMVLNLLEQILNPVSVSELDSILALLEQDDLSSGFDSIDLLMKLVAVLNDHDMNVLDQWGKHTRDVLENRVASEGVVFSDDGDLLLRSLLLLLRTSPPKVENLLEWRKSTPGLGQRVLAGALLLSGWYRGFASQKEAKKNPSAYDLISRTLCNGLNGEPGHWPSHLSVDRRESLESVEYCLMGGLPDPICLVRIEANHKLRVLFHKCKDPDFGIVGEVKLIPEENRILIESEGAELTCSVFEGYLLRWTAAWVWKESARRSLMTKERRLELDKVASGLHCSLLVLGKKTCELRYDRLLNTFDDDELRFEFEALKDGMKKLTELGITLK